MLQYNFGSEVFTLFDRSFGRKFLVFQELGLSSKKNNNIAFPLNKPNLLQNILEIALRIKN